MATVTGRLRDPGTRTRVARASVRGRGGSAEAPGRHNSNETVDACVGCGLVGALPVAQASPGGVRGPRFTRFCFVVFIVGAFPREPPLYSGSEEPSSTSFPTVLIKVRPPVKDLPKLSDLHVCLPLSKRRSPFFVSLEI